MCQNNFKQFSDFVKHNRFSKKKMNNESKTNETIIRGKRGISKIRVRYADTDRMGVVYHGKYLEYLEVGRTGLMRALGFPYSKIEEQGVGLAVVEAKVKFRSSFRL